MADYILYSGKIDNRFEEVHIFPIFRGEDIYLIHWDGYQMGKIRKIGNKWFSNSVPLLGVVNEIGEHIDLTFNNESMV